MLMSIALPDSMVGRVEELRRLAGRNLPLGEIAFRMKLEVSDVRNAADALHIAVVRDDQRGGARTKMAHRASASAFIAELRANRVAVDDHRRRIARAAPMTPEQEQDAIARFLATKGATQCPTASAEGSAGDTGPSMRVSSPFGIVPPKPGQ